MPLDLPKAYYLQRNRLKTYSCVVIGAKLSSPFTTSDIEPFVSQLVAQRAALRRNIINGEVKEVTFDVSEAIEESKEGDDLLATINRAHGVFFALDSGKATWKFVKVGDWLLFAYDHTFLDGTSGTLVLEDLVTLMRGGVIEPDVLKDKEFDELIKATKWFVAKAFLGMIRDSVVSYFWPGEKKEITDVAVESRHCIVQLDKAQMGKIKEFTKKEGITFTNLLILLNVYILSHLNEATCIKLDMPVNERRYLNAPRAYGHHSSTLLKKINTDASWESVKKQTLTTQLELEKSPQVFGTLAYVNHDQFLKDGISKPPSPTSIEISNIGMKKRVDGIEAFIFSQPDSLTAKNFTNNVVSTEDLNIITMSYAYDSKMFETYRRLMETALFRLGEVGATMYHEELIKSLRESP